VSKRRKQEVLRSAPAKRQKWFEKDRWIIGLILFLTVLAYANSLNGEFVYDDWYQVERNPAIKSWSFLPSIFSRHVWEFANTENMPVSGLYYRPIFNFALLVNYQLFGTSVIGWHLVSLLFHLGTTALVYRLGRLWNFERLAAAIAALVFGLHPIHVETVAWASALPDLLLGFFVLSGLVLYERFRQTQRHRALYYSASLVCGMLAVGAKETGIVLPLFLLAREALDAGTRAGPGARIKAIILRVGPFAAVVVGYLQMRHAVLGFIAKTNEHTFGELVLSVPYIFTQYLKKLVAPYPLAFIYDYEFVQSALDARFWGCTLLLLAVAAFIIRSWNSSPGAMKALALFVIFLLPALNLRALTPIESIAHDRYLYLPSAGFFLGAAFGVAWLASRLGRNRETCLLSAGVVSMCLLGPMTFFQNRTWQNDTVLTEHAVRFAPRWAFLHLHLAEVYEEKGRIAEAENELKNVLALSPGWASGYATLGNFYSKRGRLQEAERLFVEALRQGGANVLSTRINLAVTQIRLGKLPEAKTILEQVLGERPENTAANFNLGLIHEKQDALDLAEERYLKAISKDPAYVDPRINLAAILVREKRFDQAFSQIETVRKLAPQNSEILFSLAGAYLQSQKCDLAVETLNQLSVAQPRQPRVFVMLGISFECLGQTEKAKTSFQRAIDLAPQDPVVEVARRHLEQLSIPK
jgi:Tfp pilus assembly protein PilF